MLAEKQRKLRHHPGSAAAASRPDPLAASARNCSRLIGAGYLHGPTGRPVVMVDHEHRRPRADGSRARTGRVIVCYIDTALEILFPSAPEDLLEQLTLPCVARKERRQQESTP